MSLFSEMVNFGRKFNICTWHMKSANNLETLNRSHMIFLPFFNAFNCCVLLSKFPFDHKQSTLNIIQNSLFSTTISSWHTKKKECLRSFPFQMSEWIHTLVDTRSCPSNRIDPFMAASSMNIFAHIVKFVCECVCVAFLWTRCKMASDRKGIKNLMASMGKLMPRWKIRRKCFRPAKRALKAKRKGLELLGT